LVRCTPPCLPRWAANLIPVSSTHPESPPCAHVAFHLRTVYHPRRGGVVVQFHFCEHQWEKLPARIDLALGGKAPSGTKI
jgi:hypothetical protein